MEGVGRIGKERNNCRDFSISSLDQILTKVIPHFYKYSLKTQKYADYLLFNPPIVFFILIQNEKNNRRGWEVVMMMQGKEHLSGSADWRFTKNNKY